MKLILKKLRYIFMFVFDFNQALTHYNPDPNNPNPPRCCPIGKKEYQPKI